MIKELLFEEIKSIREEYLNVKKCQHIFFIFEITTTGAILSFLLPIILKPSDNLTIFHLFSVFSPLIVIIPSMLIIFDKGITLNRIAGFLMVIEYTLTKFGRMPEKLEGWERGCLEFRRRAKELKANEKTGTQGPNQFYRMVFFISLILIAVCLALFLLLFFTTYYSISIEIFKNWTNFIIALIISLFLLFMGYATWMLMQLLSKKTLYYPWLICGGK